MKQLVYILSLLLLTACAGKGGKLYGDTGSDASQPDSSMVIQYAIGFRVDYYKEYKRIILADPWNKGAELSRYYLVEREDVKVPDDGIRVRIPVRTLVSGSCTQYAFLDRLGVLFAVKGICDARRTYHAGLRKALVQGSVQDLGDPFQINVEKCLMLKPEVLLMNSFNKQDENLSRLMESGIPVIYDNEWMEPDLLARAEWIRFIACFFDKEMLADSLFRKVESNYLALKRKVAASNTTKPEVLSGDDFRGTWYLPGGRSYTAQLFRDAGALYKYSSDTTSGSNSYSFEQILRDFHQADVWVGVTNAATLEGLRRLDERYGLLKSFQEGNVYSYSNRTTPEGGNDFWESAVASPDLLLSDYIKVFHPELLSRSPWHYLKKMR
jgi:iron complex transport system substrate-binding protein